MALLLAAGCRRAGDGGGARGAAPAYPPTRTVEHVDLYHGVSVADPYRWLEDDNAEETKAWVAAQNVVTSAFLGQSKARGRIRDRIEELFNYERISVPRKEGGRYFYLRNDGLQNQSVLMVADALDAAPRVLLDPNTLSEDGTIALTEHFVSPDGRLLAYGISRGGSDWQEFAVREVESGKDLAADRLDWIKFSGAAWDGASSGFYYARMPETPAEQRLTAVNDDHKVYFHRVGTPQSEDLLIYERPDHPEWKFWPITTEDGRFLLIHVWKGDTKSNGVLIRDLREEGPVVDLLMDWDAQYDFIGNDGETLFFNTELGAPRRRVIAVDAGNPVRDAWREVIPEGKQALEQVILVGDRLVLRTLHRATSRVTLHRLDGSFDRDLPLPGIGTADGFTGRRTDGETFYSFTGFTFPTTIYRYDFAAGKSTVFRQPKVDFEPSDFESRQVFYKSRDGTSVSMFLTHRKGLKLDGNNPALLYGYGGFAATETPFFSTSNVVWMEMGGVYALPNLRGGSEYGEEWHQAGMLDKKQNVFDDFIAAAEALIHNRYTSRARLAIQGGSNGGLLVGACMTQRPDLFGACIPEVGVMDMLRFHRFTIGSAWVSEYGSSDDPEMFSVLRAYSPYHNLRPGVSYPATLVMTGDHDDRVVPAHSFKFAARLQACQAGTAPVLIRVETRAGHGAGTPTSKRIDAAADRLAFLARVLKIEVPRRLG